MKTHVILSIDVDVWKTAKKTYPRQISNLVEGFLRRLTDAPYGQEQQSPYTAYSSEKLDKIQQEAYEKELRERAKWRIIKRHLPKHFENGEVKL